MMEQRIDARILRHLAYDEDNCLVWTAALDRGYGKANLDNKTIRVHRYVYLQIVGFIPPGLDLDHLCRKRACANPFHLEPVTRAENLRRGAGAGGQLWKLAS